MKNKLLFLAVIFLVIAVQFIAAESFNRKNSNDDKDEGEVAAPITKKKTNRVNDHHEHSSSGSSNRRDKSSHYGSSSNSHRSRSRGPSMYNNDDDEWSPYGLAPSAYETGPYLSQGPNCFPLLDPQYPFFSDLCGAVPQARYALPNAFGHSERWQIAQVLGTILGPMSPASANPVCTRSLRLLLCPLLFPPCPTKYETRPVAPCQSFCRAVKTQCAAPGLELLPCDLLPPSSDLCPITPTPFSSLLSPFMPPPPMAGPMFPPGLPPSALSALLAQSAMAAGLPPMLPPPGVLPPPAGVPSPITPATAPSGAASSPASVLTPSPFPSVLPGVPFSSMMNPADPSSAGLASMLAASGMQSMFPGDMSSPFASMMGQSAFGSGLPPSAGFPSMFPGDMPSPFASMMGQSAFGPGLPPSAGFPSMLSPMNPLFGDSLSPILVDFPPLPFGAGAMSPAASRLFPRLRSATTEQA